MSTSGTDYGIREEDDDANDGAQVAGIRRRRACCLAGDFRSALRE